MAVLRYIVPLLAAGNVVVASSVNPCDGTSNPIVINSQSDADALATCSTIQGDVSIAKQVVNTITFNSLEQITGSLSAVGSANLTGISAPLLTSIGNQFDLNGALSLTTLSMDSLTSVGSITWVALPQLQSLTFSKGVSQAGSVSITNTGLFSLAGIALDTVGNFDLTANTALATVNVNNIKNITGVLTFAANSPSLNVDFPNLQQAVNMTFRNATSVSIPSLKSLSGQLGFFGNSFTTFSAANLTDTGDLVFDNNDSLTNISLPQLTTISGGFQIANNNQLLSIEGVPKLQTIIGALDWTGNFNNVSLPSLKEVKGGFNMQSTGKLPCSQFSSLNGGVIRGSFHCVSQATNPTTLGGTSGSNTTGPGASASSSGAAQDLGPVPVTGLTALLGALLTLLM